MSKKGLNTIQIAGLDLVSSTEKQVLNFIGSRISNRVKTLVVTPNPEFIVFAEKNPYFKALLKKADLAVPDGVGLVLASWFLPGSMIKQRITGSSLVEALLEMAGKKGWRVGIVGARGGVGEERKELMKRLQARFKGAKVVALEDEVGWEKRTFELIFACQGMGKQEKWLADHLRGSQGLLYMGVGGSLDFLTGFAKRAPVVVQNLGLEWLWRLVSRPRRHFRRVWVACVVFPGLIFRRR